jgi:ubiquinone/menaquinone biosynthesis C-methylase UbiE
VATQHAAFVGSIPEKYDEHLGPLFFHYYARDLAGRVDPATDGPVLETACGTGISTEFLREALSPARAIVATDLNEPMLDFARSRRGGLAGVRFERADAGELPFPDQSFDALVCQFGIMFFPDKARALREAGRVLRSSGQLLFNVWDSLDRNPVPRIAHEATERFFEGDPPSFMQTPFGFNEVDFIRKLLEEAGFEDVEAEVVSTVVERPSARGLAIGLVEGNPGILEIRERANAPPEQIVEAVAEAIRSELGDAPVQAPLQAIAFSARRP